ncbi:hypothetical protein PA598K_01369 [Paenibacillus sp. 598K]|nr:hypothetical protein [Paenibacillus sp. 598K]GBF73084.1 hypothetical protein PA598K_01369 [Paenibacillus sp. 598K]
MGDMKQAKELYATPDFFEVLELLKKGWLLHRVASQGDNFTFLMIRVD